MKDEGVPSEGWVGVLLDAMVSEGDITRCSSSPVAVVAVAAARFGVVKVAGRVLIMLFLGNVLLLVMALLLFETPLLVSAAWLWC